MISLIVSRPQSNTAFAAAGPPPSTSNTFRECKSWATRVPSCTFNGSACTEFHFQVPIGGRPAAASVAAQITESTIGMTSPERRIITRAPGPMPPSAMNLALWPVTQAICAEPMTTGSMEIRGMSMPVLPAFHSTWRTTVSAHCSASGILKATASLGSFASFAPSMAAGSGTPAVPITIPSVSYGESVRRACSHPANFSSSATLTVLFQGTSNPAAVSQANCSARGIPAGSMT